MSSYIPMTAKWFRKCCQGRVFVYGGVNKKAIIKLWKIKVAIKTELTVWHTNMNINKS